jgi:hypothetical protein
MVLVPTLGDQLLAPLAVLEELLTDLAAWEHEDAADPFPARQAPRLPAPLARRMALDAVWRLRAALTPSTTAAPTWIGLGVSARLERLAPSRSSGWSKM